MQTKQEGSLPAPPALTPELPPRRFQYNHPEEIREKTGKKESNNEVMTFNTVPRIAGSDKTVHRDSLLSQLEWRGSVASQSAEVVLCL